MDLISTASAAPKQPRNIPASNLVIPYDDSDLESNSERESLLSNESDQEDDDIDHLSPKDDPHRVTRIKIYIACLLANIAFIVLVPTQTKIFEQAICTRWYDANSPAQFPAGTVIPESQCKLAPIQSELASLKGLYDTFDAAPALVMSIPAGILMDVLGRRPLLLAGLCTVTAQQFWIALVAIYAGKGTPPQLIWMAPLLNFVGGGMIVLQLAFLCLVTDITPGNGLAAALFRLGAIGQFCRVIGPIIAGVLMQIDAWWAMLTGLALLVATTALSWTVPETMTFSESIPTSTTTTPSTSKYSHIWPQIRASFASLKIVWSDRRLILLILLYPFLAFGAALPDVLQQYISIRYAWSLADATFIFSLQGVSATLTLFLLLPYLSNLLEQNFAFSPTRLNATMARLSCLIAILAYTIEGLAPNVGVLVLGLVIETLAVGGGAALKALAASLVEQKDNGRVFSVVAIAEVAGSMFAYTTIAASFNEGLNRGGGVALGFPFFLAAAGAAVGTAMLWVVRWERRGVVN